MVIGVRGVTGAAETGAGGVFFEIYRQDSPGGAGTSGANSGGSWRWRLKCPNGETITSGESYADHAECLRAVYLIRSTSTQTPIRDVR